MNKTTKSRLALWLCLLTFFILGTANAAAVDYSDQRNWACRGSAPGPTQAVDVFFVGPTTFLGNAAQFSLPLADSEVGCHQRGKRDLRCQGKFLCAILPTGGAECIQNGCRSGGALLCARLPGCESGVRALPAAPESGSPLPSGRLQPGGRHDRTTDER